MDSFYDELRTLVLMTRIFDDTEYFLQYPYFLVDVL